MKYNNTNWGTIQFIHRPRGDQRDGVNSPYSVDAESWANIPPTQRRLRGDSGESPDRPPREMLVWFWLGFCWGAVSCCAFTIAALARGWLEVLL